MLDRSKAHQRGSTLSDSNTREICDSRGETRSHGLTYNTQRTRRSHTAPNHAANHRCAPVNTAQSHAVRPRQVIMLRICADRPGSCAEGDSISSHDDVLAQTRPNKARHVNWEQVLEASKRIRDRCCSPSNHRMSGAPARPTRARALPQIIWKRMAHFQSAHAARVSVRVAVEATTRRRLPAAISH